METRRHRGLAGRIDDLLARLLLVLPGYYLASREDKNPSIYPRWLARPPDGIICDDFILRS